MPNVLCERNGKRALGGNKMKQSVFSKTCEPHGAGLGKVVLQSRILGRSLR